MSSIMNGLQNRMSPQWNYTYFRLQLILSNPNIQIVSISKNPSKELSLTEKQNYFKIDAAINITEQSPQLIQQLKNNMKKGSIFKCGRISQQPKFNDGFGNPKIYKMLLFKIVIKNLLPIYRTNLVNKEDLIDFTQQYDSIYMANPKQQISAYEHDYLLKSNSQYFWQYQIQYKYINVKDTGSRFKKWNSQDYLCEECKQTQAVWFCKNQKILFCTDCYQDVHKGRNRISHKKQLISSLNCFKNCLKITHNDNFLNYYCLLCKQLKCNKCVNDAVHSKVNLKQLLLKERIFLQEQDQNNSRKNSHHYYIQVQSLVQYFKKKQFQINNELKNKITTKIKQIQGVISLLSTDYEKKLKNLEQIFKIQIIKLKRQSRKQINEAVSIHIDLKRKYDQTLWMQKFIQHNQRLLDIQSNIDLRQLSTNYMEMTKAYEYFDRIDQKITKIKISL